MKIIYYRQRVEKKVPSQGGGTRTFLEQLLPGALVATASVRQFNRGLT